MKKLFALIGCMTFLSGCAETGRLLGNVTMVPVRVVTGNMYTEDGAQSTDMQPLLEQGAQPMHMSN